MKHRRFLHAFYELIAINFVHSSILESMKRLAFVVLNLVIFGSHLFGQSTQALILPDVVDGGGWQSTIVLTNSTGVPATATLIFHSDTSGGGTQPWTPPFLEVSSTSGIILNGGSSLYLHTRGTSAALSQGWAELNASAGVMAYVIFTNRVPGRQDQDATATAAVASNRALVPYDDASGFATAIAVVNPTSVPLTISVGFRTTTGGVALGTLPTVPAQGHMTFALAQQFPVIAGHEGLAEFYSASGNFTMIALRFNPTNSSTAAPVFLQTGSPLIATPPVVDTPPVDIPPPYDPYGYVAVKSTDR